MGQDLELAKQHLSAGRLAEAESICRQILAVHPQQAEALHSLGIIHYHLGNALYERGQLEDAIGAYRQALALRPDFVEAFNNLAGALQQQGHTDEAITAWRRALALRPDIATIHNNLGNALRSSGQLAEAVNAFHRATELEPGMAAAHYYLGQALRDQGQADGAIAAYQRALQLDPGYAEAHASLGTVLQQHGRLREATAAYQAAVRLRPESADFRYLLDVATGNPAVTRAPASYIRQVFDAYAPRFDEHLVDTLTYRVPALLVEAVVEAAPGRIFDVMDLGCGTGLCGERCRSVARYLAGVDLAPRMLAKAAARGIYDRLITGDITPAMREQPDRFDLILAGDVFVYVGDLAEVFSAAACALRAGGILAFSVERLDGDGFRLLPTGRFAHSLAYIRGLGHAHGLREIRAREAVLRKHGGIDVAGWLVLLQKSGAA
jgi:predicted TPR repeat methyltransferase